MNEFQEQAENDYKEQAHTYTIIVADDEEELRRALIEKVDWESVGFTVIGEAEIWTYKREKLTAYEKAKFALREFALNWQYNFSRFTWYFSELEYMQGFFEEYGKRYGLYTEFHENAIC